jgi:hypothetical protein
MKGRRRDLCSSHREGITISVPFWACLVIHWLPKVQRGRETEPNNPSPHAKRQHLCCEKEALSSSDRELLISGWSEAVGRADVAVWGQPSIPDPSSVVRFGAASLSPTKQEQRCVRGVFTERVLFSRRVWIPWSSVFQPLRA